MPPAAAERFRFSPTTIWCIWTKTEPYCATTRTRPSITRNRKRETAGSFRWSEPGPPMKIRARPSRPAATAIRTATAIPPGATAAAETRTTCDQDAASGHSALPADQTAHRRGRDHGPRRNRGPPDSTGESGSPLGEESVSIDQQLSSRAVGDFQPPQRHGFLPVRSRHVRNGLERGRDPRKRPRVPGSVAGVFKTPRNHPRQGEPEEHHRPPRCFHTDRDRPERRLR